jgi:translation initiation factor eIF-2B subunit gamma
MELYIRLVQADFIVLPCDITLPSTITLSALINRHRNQLGSLVTSLWYEKAELELKDPDGPQAVLVAYDKHQEELLMVQPLEALEDDLALRMSLLAQ